MKSEHMAKIKKMAQELITYVETCEGMAQGDEMADNAPEPSDDEKDEGDDVAEKALRMKMEKYKA